MVVFTASASISTGLTQIDFSGNNAVGYKISGSPSPDIYYSTNKGLTWNNTGLILTNVFLNSIVISGNNALFCGRNNSDASGFLYYSTDGGASWTLNTDSDLIYASTASNTVAISGNTAVFGVNYTSGTRLLFYSTDAGITWTQSGISGGAIPENIRKIAISGANAVFITVQYYLYNSTDNGATWTEQENNSGAAIAMNDVAISGNNVILGEANNISTSIDGGFIWFDYPVTNFSFNRVGVSGNNAVAVGYNSTTFQTRFYNSNNINSGGSITWNNPASGQITGASGFFAPPSIVLSGTNSLAIVNPSSAGYNLYSSSTIAAGSSAVWNTTSLSGLSNLGLARISGEDAIVSSTNALVYYSSSPFCFEKNTLILVIENNAEVYKKVSELKVGDVVKTYKHGNKKIKIIKSFQFNPSKIKTDKSLLYKMKDNDVILTGKHGILVDEITEEELQNMKRCRTTLRYIDDKKVLPSCASNKFEKITTDNNFELWNFVLENNNSKINYGVYINNGILSESCSEAVMSPI